MTRTTIDISGVVCPFCILRVQEAMDRISPGDELAVVVDHPPAAKDSIPAYSQAKGWTCTAREAGPGLWELLITR
jgi:TusA-related sulfurtransferase